MRTISVILIFILFPKFLFSQGEFNNWYFGIKAGLTFNNIPPVPLMNNLYTSGYNTASISDSVGNFLFLVNGALVVDKNMEVMPNGTLGSGTSINNLAVSIPGAQNKYYLFTSDYCGFPYSGLHNGLRFSILDMNLNSGLGDIIPDKKNISITSGYWSAGELSATRHQNNKDVWLCIKRINSFSDYAVYKITPLGIDSIPIVSTSLVPNPTVPGECEVSSLRFSPNGNKMVATYGCKFEVTNFNKLTGVITPLFTIVPTSMAPPCNIMGCEFSIDNHYLYVTTFTGNFSSDNIYQYDVTKEDSASFKQSELVVGNDRYGRINIQRGPDNRIYYSRESNDSLCVISNPELPGILCNFQKNIISLNFRYGLKGMPSFLEKYSLYLINGKTCTNDSVSFSMTVWPTADSIHWNFGDPSSGIHNESNLSNPSHLYSNPGNYTVELFVRYIDKRTDTVWRTITVSSPPQPSLGPDQSLCSSDSVTLDAGQCIGCNYQWVNSGTGLTVGTSQTFTTGTPGTYSVFVSNPQRCEGSDTIQINITPPPQLTTSPLFKTICSGESTNILLISLPGATYNWTATLTSGSITGFSADSGMVINQTLVNNGITAGVVTYTITPKLGSCLGTPADFVVTVIPGDSVNVAIVASGNNICAGTSVTFTATPTGTGTLTYDWKVNGISQGNNNPIFNYTPAIGDIVTCVLSSSITACVTNNPATSNAITMVVNPLVPVGVGITASANPVCQGSTVALTATPTGGGSAPSFQWVVNGITSGGNAPVFTYTPDNGDVVTCTLTSSENCPVTNPVTSQPVTMSVNPNIAASVSISASVNPVCAGLPVTFTATPVNGGTPVYQWQVNGLNAGTSLPSYVYIPSNGDIVRCRMTSSLPCTDVNPVLSNQVTMTISATPVVSFIRCTDSVTTINAKPIRLKGGIPLGGTYSGPGVNSVTGLFTPSLAGTGTKTITYSYTNAGLCSDAKTKTITVLPAPAFTCGNAFTDIRDNRVYQTVLIGSQCWFAEDLNFGSEIPESIHQRDNCLSEKYGHAVTPSRHYACYQWDEVMCYDNTPGLQGLCPPGWHIPAQSEWQTLFSVWTSAAFAASALKYSGFSGFNALLNGASHNNAGWHYTGFATFFWTSTSHGPYKAWAHGMNEIDPSVSSYPSSRENAFGVRCLKD